MQNQKKVCVYSELDVISGTIHLDKMHFKKLIFELKLALITHDIVILNTGSLTGNPMTLPALEELAPFVKSGLLWTSGDLKRDSSPAAFIDNRIDRDFESNTNLDLQKMKSRWIKIAPKEFAVKREIFNQVDNANKTIIEFLLKLIKSRNENSRGLREILEYTYLCQSKKIFSREGMLAKLLSLSEDLSKEDIFIISDLIQGVYLDQGKANKGNFDLFCFNGGFFKRNYKKLQKISSVNLTINTNVSSTNHLIEALGGIKKLTTIPVKLLFEILNSQEWKKLSKIPYAELQKYEESEKKSIESKLDRFYRQSIKIPTNLLPLSYEEKWMYPILLFTERYYHDSSVREYTIDFLNRKLIDHAQNKTLKLTKLDFYMMASLSVARMSGIRTKKIIQLYFDIDVIKSNNFEWSSVEEASFDQFHSIRNKIYVRKHNLNKKIKPMQLEIINDENIWKLVRIGSKIPPNIKIEKPDCKKITY